MGSRYVFVDLTKHVHYWWQIADRGLNPVRLARKVPLKCVFVSSAIHRYVVLYKYWTFFSSWWSQRRPNNAWRQIKEPFRHLLNCLTTKVLSLPFNISDSIIIYLFMQRVVLWSGGGFNSRLFKASEEVEERLFENMSLGLKRNWQRKKLNETGSK